MRQPRRTSIQAQVGSAHMALEPAGAPSTSAHRDQLTTAPRTTCPESSHCTDVRRTNTESLNTQTKRHTQFHVTVPRIPCHGAWVFPAPRTARSSMFDAHPSTLTVTHTVTPPRLAPSRISIPAPAADPTVKLASWLSSCASDAKDAIPGSACKYS